MDTAERLRPFLLAVPFTTVVTGLFNLSGPLPVPLALLAGAGWGVALGLVLTRVGRHETAAAWLEDAFVVAGATAAAFAACGGLMALLVLAGALDSPSLTGETLLLLFLPTIPFYVVTNSLLELLIVPGLLYLGWRAGPRRALLVAAAGLYFLLRVWTYSTFVPARLGFAEASHANVPLTAAERQRAHQELMVDDPRWIPLLVMFGILLLAAHLPRLRERR